ncbi:hypothetical protein DKP76_10555 [Falsochrobactrum shanghaiense]|uniref:Tail tape measure protein n=1 Tax=Falsochrobactrum shanghaiense TaxID=2201899 RepID=A0A316JA73_9HYPH|nr:hypothetical protein [Falsochrobactrum shanghaiense]PWL18151.1 hypothetical protein DKP76_10555 [Falsochrobactrum shanghaiense]
MADDTERLFVALEARVNQFEKEWKRAERTGSRTFQQLRQNSSRATRQMEQDATRSASRVNQAFATIGTKVGGYSKAFAGGVWGGIAAGGLAGVTAAVRGVAASFAELSYEAKTAGINVEDFQRWRYVADQNKIGIDAMIDGFKELNLRADEYIQTGKGSAAESFQRLGMSPDEVKERIKDPSKFMLELIDRTRRLKDTAAGVRIFDELLGGSGGEQFVRLIEQGREGITATLNEADKMGAVMDENFIKKAEEVDKKFNQIATTIGSTLKAAIVDAVTALQGFISQWNALNEKSVSGIKAELEILRQGRERLNTTQAAGGIQDRIAGIFGKDRESQLAAIIAREKLLNDELDRRKNIIVTTPEQPPVAPYIPPEKPGKGGSKKSDAERERDRTAKAAERERLAVESLIAELQFEASLVGKTALEKEKMIALRQAGAAATAKEKEQIEALIESTYRQNEAWEASQQRLMDINNSAREATGSIIQGMLNGESASDALANALGRVADRLLDDVLDAIFKVNQAGSGGIFGQILGLFGGGGSPFAFSGQLAGAFAGGGIGLYARGSTFTPGGTALVGEQGPELVHLPRGSQVTPNHMLGKEGAGGRSQNVNVQSDVRVSVDKDGNLQAYVVAQSAQAAQKTVNKFAGSQDFKARTVMAVRDAKKRGMLR